MKKGAGGMLRFFYSYIYSINSDLAARQIFLRYFPNQFIDLLGKSSERGLDKICRKSRGRLEALLVGVARLGRRHGSDAVGWF